MGKWKVAIATSTADYISHHFKKSKQKQPSESSPINPTSFTDNTRKHPKWPFRRWSSTRQRSKRDKDYDYGTGTGAGLDQVVENSGTAAMQLVGIGMAFGMLYSMTKNRQEVERLNGVLKQEENLVRDLEEEIEMKDSLIMKEVTSDDDSTSHSVSVKEKKNSFSEIEAELEAELEILERSMASSKLETKISNLAEVDSEFEPGVAQSELRDERLDETNESGASCATYAAVCPTELRLRLHEVLQSQLEERIRELEAQIEGQNHKSWNEFSNNNTGFRSL